MDNNKKETEINFEQKKSCKDLKPAFQDVFGEYLAVFEMGKITSEMVKVRPLTEQDIWSMIGWMNEEAEKK